MGLASHANEIDAPLLGRIAAGAHILPVRVHWEDTDAGGIVYHASYLRFMERGRTEMLRVLGLEQTALRDQYGLNYVVSHLSIDYRAPGLFDMALRVVTAVRKMGAARLDLVQTVMHDDTLLTEARVQCVGINQAGKPERAPDSVRAAFGPMLK